MKKSIFRSLFLVFFLLSGKGFTAINQNGDFQIWDFTSFHFNVKREYGYRIATEFRWGDDASKLYLVYLQAQATYLLKRMEISPGYRQQFSRTNGTWTPFYMPMVDVTLFFPGQRWAVNDRSRIFYQIPKQGLSSWIYRNRLFITSPPLMRSFDLRYFIFEEAFFQERVGFDENRIAIGLLPRFFPSSDGQLYYMYRRTKQNQVWTYQNVLCFYLFFYF